jgi:cathepsin F
MRTFISAAFAALAAAEFTMDENDFKFVQYMTIHGKNYSNVDEYNLRKARFIQRDEEIAHLNETETTSTHGHNHFSDWTQEEFDATLGLKNMGAPRMSDNVLQHEDAPHKLLGAPTTWDWRANGAVTAVKNQASCGSCYAFAAAEVIESNRKITYGNLMNMSTQQYVSCS